MRTKIISFILIQFFLFGDIFSQTKPDSIIQYTNPKLHPDYINNVTKFKEGVQGYFVPLKINYKGYVKDVIIEGYAFNYFKVYLKINYNETRRYIRDKLLNNRVVDIPYDIDNAMFLFLDIGYSDSIFEELSNNKDAFLKYYFDDNHKLKPEMRDKYNELYNQLSFDGGRNYLFAAIAYQLAKWGIGMYFKKEDILSMYYEDFGLNNLSD